MLKTIAILILTCFVLSGCSNQNQTQNTQTNTKDETISVNRTAAGENITNTSFPERNNEIVENTTPEVTPPKLEQELSSFTTKIYTKDSERQNNIQITCSKLNGTTVENGATFSFTQTIGPATSAKGYQEADIFDSNGNKKKGLGGGNCQISSTLYNAVLEASSLEVIERHEHSNKVPYVKKGKDAAVAYR